MKDILFIKLGLINIADIETLLAHVPQTYSAQVGRQAIQSCCVPLFEPWSAVFAGSLVVSQYQHTAVFHRAAVDIVVA